MNWEVIGALAELLGALGVIGSLVYIASQVRESTNASRIESKLRVTEMMVDFGDKLLENPELNKVMLEGRKGIGPLSKEDYISYSNLCQKACWFLSAAYFMYQKQAISDDDWYEFKVIALYWVSSHGFQQWWEKFGNNGFTGEFKAYIEHEIQLAQKNEQ